MGVVNGDPKGGRTVGRCAQWLCSCRVVLRNFHENKCTGLPSVGGGGEFGQVA